MSQIACPLQEANEPFDHNFMLNRLICREEAEYQVGRVAVLKLKDFVPSRITKREGNMFDW